MSFISVQSVADRLEDFGVILKDSDITTVELSIAGTEEYIKNYCNISVIPTELYNTAVDICCGTFLKTKSSIGALEFVSENGAVSSITEGDVSVGFREGTGSGEIFKELISGLINKRGELECFRKLRW